MKVLRKILHQLSRLAIVWVVLMNLFKKIYYALSPYVNADERRVARFFARVREGDDEHSVKDALLDIVQQNVAAVNLWGEYRYKGYKYLTKSTRRKMYENLESIKRDFYDYIENNPVSVSQVVSVAESLKGNSAKARSEPEKLVFLFNIMSYLNPRRGLYSYRKASSFGRLLRDPSKEVLEGDCNQIVTLYIYLYSTKFNVKDLQLLMAPNHVALYFKGVGIETTSATFREDDLGEVTLVPVQEIVSTNLLDTTDSYFQKNSIPAETYLQAARLAYVISSERDIVRQNLKVAYSNAVKELIQVNRYDVAMKYAKQDGSSDLLWHVAQTGARYFAGIHQYSKAHSFASYAKGKTALTKAISHDEGAYLYNNGKYHEAIKAFRRASEEDMIKSCYEALYVKEQKLLENVKTIDELKANSAVLHRMQDYARKSGNLKLINHTAELMGQLTK